MTQYEIEIFLRNANKSYNSKQISEKLNIKYKGVVVAMSYLVKFYKKKIKITRRKSKTWNFRINYYKWVN